MDGFAFSVGAVDRALQAIRYCFDGESPFLWWWTWAVLGLGDIEFPSSGLVVGGPGDAAENQHRHHYRDCKQHECTRSHSYLLLRSGWGIGARLYHHGTSQ